MTTPTLRDELKQLIRGYVNLLEAARQRIIWHGGHCDSVETMEAQDPYLIRARAALAAQPELPEPVARQFQDREGEWHHFTCKRHYDATVKDGTWPIRSLYTAAQLQQAVEQAQAKREPMTDEEIKQEMDDRLFFEHPTKIARAIEAHHNIGDKA